MTILHKTFGMAAVVGALVVGGAALQAATIHGQVIVKEGNFMPPFGSGIEQPVEGAEVLLFKGKVEAPGYNPWMELTEAKALPNYTGSVYTDDKGYYSVDVDPDLSEPISEYTVMAVFVVQEPGVEREAAYLNAFSGHGYYSSVEIESDDDVVEFDIVNTERAVF